MNCPKPVRYTLGLDLGKTTDYSALAIVEEPPASVREDLPRAGWIARWSDDPDFKVTWLQRWPLQTSYAAIAADVAATVVRLAGRPGPPQELQLYVDGTGVGVAVLELLRAQPALGLVGVQGVTITAGHATTKAWNGRGYDHHVPKKELVGAAQVALQRGKLRVAAALPEAATLAAELRQFEVRVTDSANLQFSHREGQHDDLAISLAAANWWANRPLPQGTRFYGVDGSVVDSIHGVIKRGRTASKLMGHS